MNTDDKFMVLSRSHRVRNFFVNIMSAKPFREASALDRVLLQLASRIMEYHFVCHDLVERDIDCHVTIMTLARAQYESQLTLQYIYAAKTDEARNSLALKFIEFGHYQEIQVLGHDNQEYRNSLSPEEQGHYDRRIEIWRNVKKNFSTEQKKQPDLGEPISWCGKGWRAMADALGCKREHDEFYGMLCTFAHPSAATSHHSVSFNKEGISFSQPVSDCWLPKMCRVSFVAAVQIRRERDIENFLQDEWEICQEQGMTPIP